MPRESSFTSDQLAERALNQFWQHGFHATSMDALVRSTNVSRHGIYATFGGKKGLFDACFKRYQDLVVTPAFRAVEQADADLDTIAAYFETQIALAEKSGLPGPGCFVGNSSTEVAPHDPEVQANVDAHNNRLRLGFLNALTHASADNSSTHPEDLRKLADVCVTFTTGLWSASRATSDADDLRLTATHFLRLVRKQIQ